MEVMENGASGARVVKHVKKDNNQEHVNVTHLLLSTVERIVQATQIKAKFATETFRAQVLAILWWLVGPLDDSVTWYKITPAGEQVAQRDFQEKATRNNSPGPAFVLDVPLRNLLTSMCDFVQLDRIVQRAY